RKPRAPGRPSALAWTLLAARLVDEIDIVFVPAIIGDSRYASLFPASHRPRLPHRCGSTRSRSPCGQAAPSSPAGHRCTPPHRPTTGEAPWLAHPDPPPPDQPPPAA